MGWGKSQEFVGLSLVAIGYSQLVGHNREFWGKFEAYFEMCYISFNTAAS